MSRSEETPPATVEEALERARVHGQRALGESIATVRALLDAASLASTGEPSRAHGIPRLLERGLGELEALLAAEASPDGTGLVDAVLEALDAEIARWEERSRDDPDARAVLRAFLGLREILWEFAKPGRTSKADEEKPRPRTASARPRPVRRVRIEG